MLRTRYMTVEHVVGQPFFRDDTGRLHGYCEPLHHLTASYHWVSLGSNHIIAIAQHSIQHHRPLHEHPQIVVLPFIGHNKTLKEHYAQKDKLDHHRALCDYFNLEDHHNMCDFVDVLVEKFGPTFLPKS